MIITARTYGQFVHDFAAEWVDDYISLDGRPAIAEQRDTAIDDLAHTLQAAVEDWLEDRCQGRPFIHAMPQKRCVHCGIEESDPRSEKACVGKANKSAFHDFC